MSEDILSRWVVFGRLQDGVRTLASYLAQYKGELNHYINNAAICTLRGGHLVTLRAGIDLFEKREEAIAVYEHRVLNRITELELEARETRDLLWKNGGLGG